MWHTELRNYLLQQEMFPVGSKATRTNAYPLSHTAPSATVYNPLVPLEYARDAQHVFDELSWRLQ